MKPYSHTQHGPQIYILLAVALILAVSAFATWGQHQVGLVLAASGALVFVLAFCFRSLTVEDEGDVLRARFGPIPLFRKSIAYADMTRVEATRSRVLDGWGIHYVPGRGWTYNLWGFDCVEIHTGGSITRVGTDDAKNLEAFLAAKLGEQPQA